MLMPPSTSGGTWTQTTLYSFVNSPDGAGPYSGLTSGQDGTLYGTTNVGGASACRCGTIFSLTPPSAPGGAWTESVLHSFAGPPNDGSVPYSNLVISGDGSLYGTTSGGGSGTACNINCGVVFHLTPPSAPGGAWTETVLYNFAGGEHAGPDGAYPGPLLMGQNGSLYGTTQDGGAHGRGTVFELTPPSVPGGAWTETLLHSFKFADGQAPTGLIAGKNGVMYGTTRSGGLKCGFRQSCGTVFQMTPPASPGGAWKETVLHAFDANINEGTHPLGGVVISTGGALYGTTEMGGAGQGTVFKLVP